MSQVIAHRLPEHLHVKRLAKRREAAVQIVATAIAAGCLVGAGLFIGPINEIRKERQLIPDPESIGGLPPDIALLGKLGTFRALAIDWASIRAERLKEEGKTYEAHQLHLTVCRLAPRFPNVWVNAAWNMAYNISVLKYSPEERWQWVQNGIRLLRDEGIRYNPKSVSLYKELAWIYWHKIGDIMDDEHFNYKRALAVEMERVLGAPIVTQTEQEYFDWFRAIADAPRDIEAMLSTDGAVAALTARLERVGLGADDGLLEFMARHVRPELDAGRLLKEEQAKETILAKRLEVVTDSESSGAVRRLLAAVRSDVLRNRYKFDVDRMLKMMVDEYGPLDWRNAFTHTLYWSSLGDEITRGHAYRNLADAMNTARMVFFALQSMVMKGKIVLWPDFDDPFSSYLDMSADVRLIPYVFGTYMRLGEEHYGNDPEFEEDTPGPKYMRGLVSNMHTWIELLYMEGGQDNLTQAENYYAWLRKHNKHPDGSTQERYLATLDEFVMGDILDQLWTSKAAAGLVRSLVQRGLKQLGLGQMQSGIHSFALAEKCRAYWMKDVGTDRGDRRVMQAFPIIVRDEIDQFVRQPEIAALFKARLWSALPLEHRQMTYDRLRPYFEDLCAAREPPWSPNKAFPEPPGMDEFRRLNIKTLAPPRREGVEEGERFNR